MEFHTFGKTDAAALLLIPDRDMPWQSLYQPLQALEKDYFLILPAFDGPETTTQRAELIEDCLLADFAGRIWGAYGVGEGGDALLLLLSRGRVRIRTAVTEGAGETGVSLGTTPGRVICWFAAKDKAGKKAVKTLRAQLPSLGTVKLKKLPEGSRFAEVRPDLMMKRLKKTLGTARTVTYTAVMDRGAERLWTLLRRRAAESGEQVTENAAERTLLREGGDKLIKSWSRLTRLEPISGTETICTDQFELSEGPLTSLGAKRLLQQLKKEERYWEKTLRADKRKGWLD